MIKIGRFRRLLLYEKNLHKMFIIKKIPTVQLKLFTEFHSELFLGKQRFFIGLNFKVIKCAMHTPHS